MPIASDFTLDYTNRILTHTSGTTRYTANELYSWLMDLFDDSTQMDDAVPMSAQTPNEYALINGWFLPDATYDYLYQGAVRTIGLDAATYTNGVYRMTHQAGGYTNCVAGDIGKTVTDGTRNGVLLAYNNTSREWYVRRGTGTAWAGACTITTGTGAGTITGSVLTGEDVWANFYTLGTIESDAVVYWLQGSTLINALAGTSYTYTTGHADQLIRTSKNGTAISSSLVTAFARNNASANADLYDHFSATATATGGRNPVPLATSPDTNDTGGGASYGSVTVTFGTTSQDIGDGGGAVNYDVAVDGAGLTTAQVYERLKYITRRGETTTLNSVQGQFYISANPGSYPIVKVSPFGTYAGGKFFGARGVWLTNVSDANNRVLIDAAGVSRTPPTTISVTVTGIVSGDRVLVARSTGSGSTTINKSQFTLSGTHTSTATVTVNETLGNDIPATGKLRIADALYTYSGIVRGSKQFTGVSPVVSGAALTPLYSPLIDVQTASTSETMSHVRVSDYDVVARVRKKGILPFENTALVGVGGASISAIRTTDTIAV
jgi:hypothetical protein